MSKIVELNSKPQVSSPTAQRELDKAEKQFEKFQEQCDSMTLDRMNAAPKAEAEPQTKMSQREIENSGDIYLKPFRTQPSKEAFNEKFRSDYEFQKEYVCFIAENNEIIGETIELWTKRFPGQPAEFWKVPVNKPIWGPRYLAERIKGSTYHRLVMHDGALPGSNSNILGSDSVGTYTGGMVVDSVRQRLNAFPASTRKSIFMGASGF